MGLQESDVKEGWIGITDLYVGLDRREKERDQRWLIASGMRGDCWGRPRWHVNNDLRMTFEISGSRCKEPF
jgi:hypothetical protein